jgi:ribosomal protein S18 acetylase RimI-like enzyme
MRPAHAKAAIPAPLVRRGGLSDLDALCAIETAAFTTDLISRRSLRRLLRAPSAAVVVAEHAGGLAGYALVLFRGASPVARLYSIGVLPRLAGRCIGSALLEAAEQEAVERGRSALRLEVHEQNRRAVAFYRRAGYRQFGRTPRYYEDGGTALRFEKRFSPAVLAGVRVPPYFHQTTEFTCGPACMMMALAWADRAFRPTAALEFRLWREATTIFMTSGPGGCDPYGIAVTLRRHGLAPAIHASHAGPYFLATVRSDDRRRVMRLAQEEHRREAEALKIPIQLAPLDESAFLGVLDGDAVAIVLVSGYRMVRRNVPHWVFCFGRKGRYVLVHDPAAARDADGKPVAETRAVPIHEFAALARYGRDGLRAAVLIRKGPLQ